MPDQESTKNLLSRRNLVKAGVLAAGAGAVAVNLDASATPNPVDSTASPRLRDEFIMPDGVPADGTEDAQPGLQALLDAAKNDSRPLVLNGIYRLDRPLRLWSNQQLIGSGVLRANHSGALLASAERPVARVRIDGLRLEAQSSFVKCAIEGKTWQYARLENLRLLSAGGVFRTGILFTDVAYWNCVRSLESDCTLDLFDLGDANNLVLDDINLCRFSDIGIRSFLRFHAPCSAISGRALSIEGMFRGQTLVKLDPACAGVDLEFLRVEGRPGSSTTSFVDFNGAKANRLLVPHALYGLGGPALLNEQDNTVLAFSHEGTPAQRFGRGQLVLPSAPSDPSEQGAIGYNSQTRRLRTMVDGNRTLALSPAIEPLDLNGHEIIGAKSIVLELNGRKATVGLDGRGSVEVRDARGVVTVFGLPTERMRITGSRSDGTALAALLKALQHLGLIQDATSR